MLARTRKTSRRTRRTSKRTGRTRTMTRSGSGICIRNIDPRSGSLRLLNTDPMLIQICIQNTALKFASLNFTHDSTNSLCELCCLFLYQFFAKQTCAVTNPASEASRARPGMVRFAYVSAHSHMQNVPYQVGPSLHISALQKTDRGTNNRIHTSDVWFRIAM